MPYVCRLDEPQPLAEIGGKAFHLWRMLELQLPVPAGLVVTKSAWEAFLAQSQLRERIDQLLANADGTPESLPQISRAIRELVSGAELPAAVIAEIASALLTLQSSNFLAIRSSAVGEDSAQDSFAGQLDSLLHVEPQLGPICAAIKSCWASYWSERVLYYQQSRQIALQGMGVVIQVQIDGALSGVLFTQHPLERGQSMLLEYCPGLGDQLVSGNVTPAAMTIARDGHARNSSRQANQSESALAPTQVARLAEYGFMLERAFDGPQDIEWTMTGEDSIYLLQSRPITSFGKSATKENAPPCATVIWSNANVNENYPDPICPLLYSVASLGYYHYFRNLGLALGISSRRVLAMEQPLRQLVGVHGARLYYNLTNIYAVLRMAPFGDLLSEAFGNFVGAQQVTAAASPLTWRGFANSRWRQAWEVIVIAVRSIWQFAFLSRRVSRFERTVDQFAERTLPGQLALQSTSELLSHLRAFLDIRCHRWLNASLADAAAMLSYGLLKRLLNREFPAAGEAALHNSLLKGLRDVVSGVPAARLWELSRQIRSDEQLRTLFASKTSEAVWLELETNKRWSRFHEELNEFLAEWGFRCSGELMLTVPSFQERPAALSEILQAYAQLDGESPAQRLERQELERKAESARIFSQLRGRWLAWYVPWPRKSFVAGCLLRWTQQAIVCRERARLKQALVYSRLRRIALAIGDQLVARRRLAQRDDIFFLTASELESLLAGSAMYPDSTRELIAVRQAAHAEVTRATAPDTFSLPAGSYWQPPATDGSPQPVSDHPETALQGMGVCGGKASASAAVLSDVTEFARLTQGNILVTRQTDPGWGPVFPLIQGLVIERGGMLSHGAILAREYGLPTVVGIVNATQRIRSGQTVTVDGDRGLVELH